MTEPNHSSHPHPWPAQDGHPRKWTVLVVLATGLLFFRRLERFAMILVFASLLLVPLYFMVHPPLAQVARDLVVPQLPAGGKLSD